MIFAKIITFLEGKEYELKEHPPTPTSEESAKYRGEPMKIGAKAILVKADDEFILAVFPADRKLKSSKLRKILQVKKVRFASQDELFEITGLPKGAVPPFGHLLGLRMIVDEELFNEEYMAFNAGDLEKSIKMKTKDYRELVQPETGEFSE